MKFAIFEGVKKALKKAEAPPFIPGQFQSYNYTQPDRYPWLFRFAADCLAKLPDPNLLSFGCSRGDEVFALRKYFPTAIIKGVDIDPRNIDHCRARAPVEMPQKLTFMTAANVEAETDASFDAIFCLAVLCRGDLTANNAQFSSPSFLFERFETIVTDLARCVKPEGFLFLLTTNFRFCDTPVAANFDTVLEATPSQLADDVIFDSQNRLLAGVRYPAVGFKKHRAAESMRSIG